MRQSMFDEVVANFRNWPDPFGWRGKIGLIVPSANTINAQEWNALCPEGVSIHVTRIPVDGPPTNESYQAMANAAEEAALLLADAKPDLIVYGCTAGSVMWSRSNLIDRISNATGLPTITTSGSVIDALAHLKIRNVSVVTPYLPHVNERLLSELENAGISVAAIQALGLGRTQELRHAMSRVPRDVIAQMVRDCDRPGAEALFISCTALPSLALVPLLEEELCKPVITSNQATLWKALRTIGIHDNVENAGRLLIQEPQSQK